jgi:DNA gyrase subunit A
MPLRRLTGLEQESLRKEADDLRVERTGLRHLLDDRSALLDTMVSEFKALKKRFATPRRTRLIEGGDALVAQRAAAVRPNAELQRHQAFAALASESRLLIQADGAVKIVTPQMLGRLHLDASSDLGDNPSPAQVILPIAQQPALLAFTASGRVGLLRWEFAGQQPGNLERFLPDSLEGERVVQVLPLPTEAGSSLGLLSSDGRFKRLPMEEFQELSGRATTVLKLKDGVELKRVVSCQEGHEVVVASSTGRLLRMTVNEANLPLMGRAAQGPMVMRLLPGEAVVGAACTDTSVVLASHYGQIKRLNTSEIRLCQRGDLGQIGLRFEQRGDHLVDLCSGLPALVSGVVSDSRNFRFVPDALEAQDPSGLGQSFGLKAGEHLQKLVPLLN